MCEQAHAMQEMTYKYQAAVPARLLPPNELLTVISQYLVLRFHIIQIQQPPNHLNKMRATGLALFAISLMLQAQGVFGQVISACASFISFDVRV